MKWVGIGCLAATAVVWALALAPPAERPRPAPGIAGSYRLFRFEHAEERRGAPNPFPLGSLTYFGFRDDGTFLFLVFGAGRELIRREGFYGFDGARLTLEQISENRVRSQSQRPEDRIQAFRAEWKQDPEGPFLLLVQEPDGYQLYLRPGPIDPGAVSSER
jgi:hypothetical protein